MANPLDVKPLKLADFFNNQKRLLLLQQEVTKLRKDNDKLRAQNASMRDGMRRCVTCEYRLDFKERQGNAPVLNRRPKEQGQ